MAFPGRYTSLTHADRLQRARIEATSVKTSFTDLINFVTAGNNLSATKFINLTGNLAGLRMEIAPLLSKAGMEDYATKEFGRGILADAQAIINKIDEIFTLIKIIVPKDKDGHLLICFWDVDGTLGWKGFTPQELAPLRTKIQELIALIE